MSEAQEVSTTPEPIQKVGGDSITTFDELESVGVLGKSGTKESAKQSKSKEDKSSQDKREVKNGKEEESQEGKESSKESLLKDSKEAVDKTQPPIKTFKVKNGDAEIELRADTPVPVKVDGKEIQVPLQEALRVYSGTKHLENQYTKFKADREAFDADKQGLSTFLKDVNGMVESQNILGAFKMIGDATGQDGVKLYDETLAKLTEQAKQFADMSPEQIKAAQLEAKVKHWEETEAKQRAAKAEEQELEAEKAKVDSVVNKYSKYGLSMDTFMETYDRMVELAKVSKLDPSKITSEDVGEFYAHGVSDAKALKILKDVDSNPDTVEHDRAELRSLIKENPDLSDENIREIALEVYGKETAQRLAKKINKMDRQNAKKPPMNPSSDPWSFDQLA